MPKRPAVTTFISPADITVGANTYSHTSGSWQTLPNGSLLEVMYQTDPAYPGQQSPYAIARITYDTVAPASPNVLIPNPFNNIVIAANPQANPTMLVSGNLPADGHICVGANPNSCALYPGNSATTFQYGGQFSVAVPVSNGNNTIYVMSEDAAGNFSKPVIGNVYVVAPPSMAVTSPSDGATLSGASITFTVSVSAASQDSGSANPNVVRASNITEVQVEIGGTYYTATASGNGNYTVTIDATTLSNGPQTVTVNATDALGATYVYPAPGSSTNFTFTYDNGIPFWVNSTDGSVERNGGAISSAGALNPASVIDSDGNLYVVWQDNCASNANGYCAIIPTTTHTVAPDIFLRKRAANGTWGNIVLVSTTGVGDETSTLPSITLDQAGYIHIVWEETGTVNGQTDHLPGLVHRVMDPATGTLSLPDVQPRRASFSDINPQLASNSYSGFRWRSAPCVVRPKQHHGPNLLRQVVGLRHCERYQHIRHVEHAFACVNQPQHRYGRPSVGV